MWEFTTWGLFIAFAVRRKKMKGDLPLASERILCRHTRICVFHVVLTTSTDCFPKEFCPINLSDEHGLSAPRSEN